MIITVGCSNRSSSNIYDEILKKYEKLDSYKLEGILEMTNNATGSGMGTCGFVGQIGVYTGWVESGNPITAMDWIGLVLICFVLPAILSVLFCNILRKWGWIKSDDLKLNL